FFGQSMSTGQVIELAHDARLAEAQHAPESNAIVEAADGVEKAARDLRLALGPAAGRIALAQLRERSTFDRALDALAGRLTALAEGLRGQEERAEEIRNARQRADAFVARIGEWREADARPKEDAYGEAAGS